MKTLFKQTGIFLLIVILSAGNISLFAQDNDPFFTISGVVKDKSSKKKLEHVTLSVPGTNVGTVTNEDGEFSLKIKNALHASVIELSHVGYHNLRIPVNGNDIQKETVYLTPSPQTLNEVIIQSWKDPQALIEEALNRIELNYSTTPSSLTGFYRETAKKGRNYINISEAIINIYKTSYTRNANNDRVQIYKGRKLLSQKKSDTLAVKLLGGPNLSIFVDIVKNPEMLFDKETLFEYKFKMNLPEMIDDRLQYVVDFEPQVIQTYPLFFGKVYIDQQTLAFTRVEFSLDMKDRNKATEAILKQKPRGLRFKPEEVFFLVTYKQRDGITYLNYIRNEIKFKCDWKRRFFSTNYSVMSEMVVTESQVQDVLTISRKDAFNEKESLSDKVTSFLDNDFWGAYNIIEPTESLESAVNKLKKQQSN